MRRFLERYDDPQEPVSVEIHPWADALWFHDLDGAGLEFRHPTFYKGRADVYVVHDSDLITPLFKGYTGGWIHVQVGIAEEITDWPLIYEGAAGRRWLYYETPDSLFDAPFPAHPELLRQ